MENTELENYEQIIAEAQKNQESVPEVKWVECISRFSNMKLIGQCENSFLFYNGISFYGINLSKVFGGFHIYQLTMNVEHYDDVSTSFSLNKSEVKDG